MKLLVVLSAVFAATVAAPHYLYTTYLAQPENSPAVVLDVFGHPLDTAEVISARLQHYEAKALEGHVLKKRSIGHDAFTVYAVPSVYAAPAAVSHQSRVDVRTSSPTVVAAAPAVVAARTVVEPVSAFVSAPSVVTPVQTVVAAPAAVSHQSRVDVRTSSPTVVAAAPAYVAARTVVEPVNAIVSAPAVVTPVQTVVAAPAAVSHQSRVDVRTSVPKFVATGPVVVAKSFAPVQTVVTNPALVNVHSAYVAPATTVYAGGAAVSHQSRVDVKTSPAVITEQVFEPTYVATPVVEAGPAVIDTAPAVVDARSVYAAPFNTFYSNGFIKK